MEWAHITLPQLDTPVAGNIRRKRVNTYVGLFLCDIAAIVSGFLIVGELRFTHGLPGFFWPFVAGVVCLFLACSQRAYSAEVIASWRQGTTSALTALVIAFMITILFVVAFKSAGEFSRLWLVGGVGTAAALMVTFRYAAQRTVRAHFRDGTWSQLLILDGIDIMVSQSIDRFDASAMRLHEQSIHPLVLDELGRRTKGYDQIVVSALPERRRAWATALQGCDVPALILIPELSDIGSLDMANFAGIPTIMASAGPLKFRSAALKRALDLAITVPLLMLLSPMLLFTAIAIRIDSPGPVLFRQDRVGRGNRLFKVFKFRSMFHDDSDHAGRSSASRGDSRITRVGRFIRSTSIDELPQLFNVLRGDMSLVGPRPHALGSLAENQYFWEIDHRYNFRHACKPGLTGLAQVRGFRGATERREDLVHRLNADLEYRANWSVWRDLAILFATARVVVHRNAF